MQYLLFLYFFFFMWLNFKLLLSFSGFQTVNYQSAVMSDRASTLQNRTDSKQDSPKRLKCNFCSYSTNHGGHMKMHSLVHSDERLECEVCNRNFAHQKNLKRHMLIHTGAKPYYCNICGTRFRQSSHLTQHMNKHL